MNRLGRNLAVWTLALVVGWGLVVAFGGPVTTAADELTTALHPATPVTEQAARTSAATIIRLRHQELAGFEPTVRHATDFGGDRWVITYAQADPVAGVRISVEVVSGEVRITTFP